MKLELRDPIFAAASWLCGAPVEAPRDEKLAYIAACTVLGLGKRAIHKGSRLWPYPFPWPATEAEIAAEAARFLDGYAPLAAWIAATRKAAAKEKFVTNPFGRRAYHLTGERAQMFLVLSTVNDAVRDAVAAVPDATITGIDFGTVVSDDAARIAAALPSPFTAEVSQ